METCPVDPFRGKHFWVWHIFMRLVLELFWQSSFTVPVLCQTNQVGRVIRLTRADDTDEVQAHLRSFHGWHVWCQWHAEEWCCKETWLRLTVVPHRTVQGPAQSECREVHLEFHESMFHTWCILSKKFKAVVTNWSLCIMISRWKKWALRACCAFLSTKE